MPTLLQSASKFANSFPSTLVFPNPVTAGSLLVAYVGTNQVGTFGVSDNVNGTYNNDASSNAVVQIWTFPGAGSGTTTVSLSFTSTTAAIIIEEWSGVAAVSPFDQKATNTGSAAQTGTTGTTPTLSQNVELALAGMEVNSGSITSFVVSSPFSASTSGPVGNASFQIAAGNMITAASTGVGATFTWGTASAVWHGAISTYKPSAGGVDTLLGQGWV